MRLSFRAAGSGVGNMACTLQKQRKTIMPLSKFPLRNKVIELINSLQKSVNHKTSGRRVSCAMWMPRQNKNYCTRKIQNAWNFWTFRCANKACLDQVKEQPTNPNLLNMLNCPFKNKPIMKYPWLLHQQFLNLLANWKDAKTSPSGFF